MSKDIRIVNMTDGQMATSDKCFDRIGELDYRNLGVFSKLFFDEGKFLRISGLEVTPVSGMTVQVGVGVGIQRTTGLENFPFRLVDATNVTMSAATGSPRVDMIEGRVTTESTKTDTAFFVEDPTTEDITSKNTDRNTRYYLELQQKASSTTATAATAAVLTGTVAIPTTIDLSTVYLLNVAYGEDGDFQEIDLRGATPAATTRAEIISAINTAVGATFASTGAGNVIELTGDGTGETSFFEIKPPIDTNLDALNTVLGLTESTAYDYIYQGENDWFKIAEIDIEAATTIITDTLIRDITEKDTWASDGGNTFSQNAIYNSELEWSASTDYAPGVKVLFQEIEFKSLTGHTSAASFYTDLVSGYWLPTAFGRLPAQSEFGDNATTQLLKTINESVVSGELFPDNTIVSTYSLVYTTANAYNDGVLTVNGDIHFVPRNAAVGQKISEIGVVSTYSLIYTIANAYSGGVLAPTGDIYFIPFSAAVGQKIDSLGVVSTYSLVYTGTTLYIGGVLSSNGDIHFIPRDAAVGQKIDSSGVVSTYSLVYTTANAFSGGCLSPNGDIHFIPRSAAVGQKIDSAGVVSTYSLIYTIANAYFGGVLSPEGDIHFVPYAAEVGQKISSAGVVSTYSLVYTTTNAYNGGVLSPNGDIHFIINLSAIGQKINSAGVVSTYSLVYTTSSSYFGGVLSPNGEIHFAPASASVGQKINTLSQISFSFDFCKSPYLNKF